jgi:hypothetical protein
MLPSIIILSISKNTLGLKSSVIGLSLQYKQSRIPSGNIRLNFLTNHTELRRKTKTETTMGEALPPNIQEIVARCIRNKPNALQLIDWIKADHQEQRRKLKNRIAPPILQTSKWLDLSTRNKPATSQWTKSTAWITPITQPTEEITWHTNPYSVLEIGKMEDDDEQGTNDPST